MYHEPKEITIYAIQHCPTGRIYVGRTGAFETRMKAHFNALRKNMHPNELMQKDYNEYGDDYEIFILETLENKYPQIRDAEFRWMDELGTGDERIGYNYKDPHYRKADWELPEIVPGIPKPNEVGP